MCFIQHFLSTRHGKQNKRLTGESAHGHIDLIAIRTTAMDRKEPKNVIKGYKLHSMFC